MTVNTSLVSHHFRTKLIPYYEFYFIAEKSQTANFQRGLVPPKPSNFEFGLFEYLILSLEVIFAQIWPNTAFKKILGKVPKIWFFVFINIQLHQHSETSSPTYLFTNIMTAPYIIFRISYTVFIHFFHLFIDFHTIFWKWRYCQNHHWHLLYQYF